MPAQGRSHVDHSTCGCSALLSLLCRTRLDSHTKPDDVGVNTIVYHKVIFFFGHRTLHIPGLYHRCHKWHHKFRVTSAWTSFYAHPFDHQFVIWALLALPAVMMGGVGWSFSTPVVAAFFLGAMITFIGSHHTVEATSDIDMVARIGEEASSKTNDGSVAVIDTGHLQHHLHFNVNFVNFDLLDMWAGTQANAKL